MSMCRYVADLERMQREGVVLNGQGKEVAAGDEGGGEHIDLDIEAALDDVPS